MLFHPAIFTASAVFAVVVCPSVCPPQVGIYRKNWTNRAGFGMEAFLHLWHTVL